MAAIKRSFIFLFLLTFGLHAAEENNKDSFWNFGRESFKLLFAGAGEQFTTKNNLYYAAAAVPVVWYSFDNDQRIKDRYGGTEIKNIVDHIGDAGVAFNFPILHTAFWYYGVKKKNDRSIQFAKEYFASMYLALIETGVLSYISIHQRPVPGDTSFWETEFRGDSSWPSGHVVPYMTLFFKTMQFYGPAWATLPLVLTIASSMQRIQDQKHWLSDITSSFFLSAWASEGVRKAAGYKKNHPFYKMVFEHEFKVGYIRRGSAVGPLISWSY